MSIKDEIMRLGAQLEAEANASFDLWTWLPSHRAAEKYHGDYSSNFIPSVADIIKEAAQYLADLQYGRESTEEEYPCPCNEHVVIPGEKIEREAFHGKTITELAVEYETEPHIIGNIIGYIRGMRIYPER